MVSINVCCVGEEAGGYALAQDTSRPWSSSYHRSTSKEDSNQRWVDRLHNGTMWQFTKNWLCESIHILSHYTLMETVVSLQNYSIRNILCQELHHCTHLHEKVKSHAWRKMLPDIYCVLSESLLLLWISVTGFFHWWCLCSKRIIIVVVQGFPKLLSGLGKITATCTYDHTMQSNV